MGLFYKQNTGGDETNLQLFSLIQALKYYNKVSNLKLEYDHLDDKDFLEYYVFIIVCLGTSISQLLGQNNNLALNNQKQRENNRLPSLLELYKQFFNEFKNIKVPAPDNFEKDFIELYDDCRHFGITNHNTKHNRIAQLNFSNVTEKIELIIEIWFQVITAFSQKPINDISELTASKEEFREQIEEYAAEEYLNIFKLEKE